MKCIAEILHTGLKIMLTPFKRCSSQGTSFRKETIALLMNDPLLPAPFVNESARNQFAQDVQQLDAIGQKLWKKYMNRN